MEKYFKEALKLFEEMRKNIAGLNVKLDNHTPLLLFMLYQLAFSSGLTNNFATILPPTKKTQKSANEKR